MEKVREICFDLKDILYVVFVLVFNVLFFMGDKKFVKFVGGYIKVYIFREVLNFFEGRFEL